MSLRNFPNYLVSKLGFRPDPTAVRCTESVDGHEACLLVHSLGPPGVRKSLADQTLCG